jgi:hypothetical protein
MAETACRRTADPSNRNFAARHLTLEGVPESPSQTSSDREKQRR